MEIYILDSLFRPEFVVDSYVSFLWTERFARWGDFELVVHSTPESRALWKTGYRLIHNESYYVMTVETVEDTTDDAGRSLLKLKGRSLEEILDSRLARQSLSDTTTVEKWSITDFPADIARKIFHDICIEGILDEGDIIPGVTEASIFPVDTIGEPPEEITYEFEPKSVYAALVDLCDIYDMGFRLVRDFDGQRYFDIYMGSDRTTKQTTLPAVVFSPDMENLQNTTELTTTALYKNVAYVISPVGHEVVYPLDIDPEINGFDRRVLFVKADDIKDEDPEVASEKMIQRGKEELAKSRRFSGFDGALSQTSRYRYGVDYRLGDLVELRGLSGVTSDMQVTEQIFVSDSEGERSYPTLSINLFITPGSWLAWDYAQVWEDLGPDEYWEDQP